MEFDKVIILNGQITKPRAKDNFFRLIAEQSAMKILEIIMNEQWKTSNVKNKNDV